MGRGRDTGDTGGGEWTVVMGLVLEHCVPETLTQQFKTVPEILNVKVSWLRNPGLDFEKERIIFFPPAKLTFFFLIRSPKKSSVRTSRG